MIRALFVLLAGHLLFSCAFENPRGEGPILISKRVEQGFERYKDESNPGHFAVAVNGRHYGYSACRDTKCLKGGQSVALYSCKKSAGSIPCRIFASGKEIIWDGPINYEY